MLLGGWQKTTLVDYPGKVAATVFTAGCNFRCPYCHNPELVLPELIKEQPKISESEVFDFLRERRSFLEGLCISGGEPTQQPDLVDFIRRVKQYDYAVKLDTNGSHPEILADLIRQKLLDYVAMDIKMPRERYATLCPDAEIAQRVGESVDLLKSSGVDYEFRTTLVEGMLDEQDVLAMADWIKPAPRYFLQRFQGDKVLCSEWQNARSWSPDRIQKIIKKISPYFSICSMR